MIIQHYPWLAELSLPVILLRTALALLCAGVIGYDRDTHGAPAGFRTHILVCLGAMLAMMTGQFAYMMYPAAVEPTRIGAQVISGIGFLGAGTIILTREHRVAGLTTAAGLWASASIGIALGIGFYEGAIIGAAAIYFTERTLRRISKRIRIVHKEEIDSEIKSGN
ncbi:MAG: MgtC/SapB family protein [Mogibacterium sp.]|nr:MgtC/SapB family protein [Mogibacterium sp.]